MEKAERIERINKILDEGEELKRRFDGLSLLDLGVEADSRVFFIQDILTLFANVDDLHTLPTGVGQTAMCEAIKKLKELHAICQVATEERRAAA